MVHVVQRCWKEEIILSVLYSPSPRGQHGTSKTSEKRPMVTTRCVPAINSKRYYSLKTNSRKRKLSNNMNEFQFPQPEKLKLLTNDVRKSLLKSYFNDALNVGKNFCN